ncbi:hypothetical protein DER46DRAFT_580749 [Fusarium sp. MPI-SDFR-AT-0072]|nr:hypothetical protein DER46DRAFT_580749 [Fusarium sp. MPI-SDFR-AT-0072]
MWLWHHLRCHLELYEFKYYNWSHQSCLIYNDALIKLIWLLQASYSSSLTRDERSDRHDVCQGVAVNYRRWPVENGLSVLGDASTEAEPQGRKAGVAEERLAAEMGKIKAAELNVADGAQDLSPVILLDEPLGLVPDFRANKAMLWMATFPCMDSREAIWQYVCNEGHFTPIAVNEPMKLLPELRAKKNMP